MEQRIKGTTGLLALIGSPVGHSGSPDMYNFCFRYHNLDYSYMAFDIKEDQVPAALDAMHLFKMRGCNVTMPCKTAAAQNMDELSPAARIIGAVNTIVNENGKLVGHMTDGIGFVGNLKDHGVDVKGKKMVVLGAGGAATAIQVQCALDKAASISIFNPNDPFLDRAKNTAAKLKNEVPDCDVQVFCLEDQDKLKEEIAKASEGKKENIVVRIGKVVGRVVNICFQAGRDTIEMVVGTILPFMAFTATLLGIISASGLGNVIAKTISPICSTVPGMVAIAFVCGIPILSPVLGPGAVIAQVVGTLLGSQFALGNIPAQYALPALFAIDAQVGCDFIPVGLSLGEADSETIEYGVPAVLFERLITGPLAVLIAFAFSIGMY